jgi:hypothetical protein
MYHRHQRSRKTGAFSVPKQYWAVKAYIGVKEWLHAFLTTVPCMRWFFVNRIPNGIYVFVPTQNTPWSVGPSPAHGAASGS